MALIKRKEVVKRTSLNVSIDESLVEQLKAYSAYTNVSTSEIVETAVRYAINSDPEFGQHETKTGPRKQPAQSKAAKVGE